MNEDKALMRHELVEAIVRMSVKKHSRDIPDVSDCCDKFLNDIMEKVDPQAKVSHSVAQSISHPVTQSVTE
jgi:hypothetical protein